MASAAVPDFSQWKMNHTMIRVKDPARSMEFYRKLGFSLIDKLSQPEGNFDLYFLAIGASGDSKTRKQQRSDREGLLELTHNYGTENDDKYAVSNGNERPYLGLQHLGITVCDVGPEIEKLVGHSVGWDANATAKRNLNEENAHMEQAICRDPDGYYIELSLKGCTSERSDESMNSFNFTSLRIKNPRVSLPWYSDVLRMKLLQQTEGDGFTSYWLGFSEVRPGRPGWQLAEAEGIIKLIWIHGSERSEGKVYHNGNSQPQGFGHLAVAVDDISAACEYFETQGVTWKKRLTDGRLKSIAFILDPDEYWIEIIQNARINAPLGIQ